MSKDILNALIGQYKNASGMIGKFIDVSTDESWKATSGGFPGWQQVYHAMECVYFFLAPAQTPERASMYPMDVMLLKDVSAPVPAKAAMKALCEDADRYADKFFAALGDDDLLKQHEGASARFGRPVTNLDAITIMNGHFMYHLGYCDAILKENGQPTIF